MTITNSIPSTTSAARRPNVVPRPTTGRLRLRPTGRGRGFVVGIVDAAGPDTNGFAPRDRVAWPDTTAELDDLILIDQTDVLGVPDWISDAQVVSYLGPGLIARALVRDAHDSVNGRFRPFGRGDDVQVVSADPLVAEMTTAWARSLGARIVDGDASVTIRDDRRSRRAAMAGHGRLAQAAVEVFQAVRRGVFEGVAPLDRQLAA